MPIQVNLAAPNPVFQVAPGEKAANHNPLSVLIDADGNFIGVTGNPLVVEATLTPGADPAEGLIGDPVPTGGIQVAGENATGDLEQIQLRSADPTGAEAGVVVRNIPSGTQHVDAPGGAALALNSTLTNGTLLAQVAGTGTAGVPAAGVASIQGVPGGTPVPVSGSISSGTLTNNTLAPGANNQGVLPNVANAAPPVWTEGAQVLGSADLSGATRVTGGQTSAATTSSVASSASNVTLLAANSARKGVLVTNDSTQVLYLKYGATASAASYTVQLPAGAYWEMPVTPVYTGIIDGIWAAANGSAKITEL